MEISNQGNKIINLTSALQENAAKSFSPNNPPWNGWMAVGLWAASIFILFFFANAFLGTYLSWLKFDVSDQTRLNEFILNDAQAVFFQIMGVFPAHVLTLAIAWLIVTRNREFDFREMLGWEMNGFRIWHSFALVLAFFAIAIIFTLIFGKVENDFEIMLKSSKWIIIPVSIMAVFTAPIVEEIVYRGVLYSAFRRRFGVAAAIVFVTLLFASIHVMQYSQKSVPDYGVMLTILLLSLTLTAIRERTANLLPCIILHMMFNGFQAALMIISRFAPGIDASA